jgi:hypothetical protein
MIPTNASSFGRAGGRLRRQPGGTENVSIFATVRRVNAETPRRLSTADPLDPDRVANPTIQLHEVRTASRACSSWPSLI